MEAGGTYFIDEVLVQGSGIGVEIFEVFGSLESAEEEEDIISRLANNQNAAGETKRGGRSDKIK